MKKNNISKLKNCYGCGVCSTICPVNIIDIKESSSGFYVPIITDENKCINCGRCLDICAYNSDITFNAENIQSYAAWSTDKSIRYSASSGGVAYELGKKAILSNIKYCGVKYDSSSKRAVHFLTDNITELSESLGSKYIPSYTSKAFKELLSKQDSNNKYIVIGTPCQIASFRLAIKKLKKEDNFILVDFFCHGVPSLKVWDRYLHENPEIGNLSFIWRDKKYGWHNSWYIVGHNDSDKVCYRSPNVSKDLFFNFFLGHHALSPCCLDACKFKKLNSSADIRLGDLWGTKYRDNEDGVSGVICLTTKGKEFVNSTENLYLIEESNYVVTEGQMATNASKPCTYTIGMFLLKESNLKLKKILKLIKLYNTAAETPRRILRRMRSIFN